MATFNDSSFENNSERDSQEVVGSAKNLWNAQQQKKKQNALQGRSFNEAETQKGKGSSQPFSSKGQGGITEGSQGGKNIKASTGKKAASGGKQAAAGAAQSGGESAAGQGGSSVAAGAASGSKAGWVGALIGAIWGARHVIIKVIVVILLFFTLLVSFFKALPNAILQRMLNLGGRTDEMKQYEKLGIYSDISTGMTELDEAYQVLLEEFIAIQQHTLDILHAKCVEEGWAWTETYRDTKNEAVNQSEADCLMLLSIYSLTLNDAEALKTYELQDIIDKLEEHRDEVYPIVYKYDENGDYVTFTETCYVPTPIPQYTTRMVTLASDKPVTYEKIGSWGGSAHQVPIYGTQKVLVYEPYEPEIPIVTDIPTEIPELVEKTFYTYREGLNGGTRGSEVTYLVATGRKTTFYPDQETKVWPDAVIEGFNIGDFYRYIGLDPYAQYQDTDLTNMEMATQTYTQTSELLGLELPSSYLVTEMLRSTGLQFRWPLVEKTVLSDHFGVRKSPFDGKNKMHSGIDIPTSHGTDIHATEAGTVVAAVTTATTGSGLYVVIDHGNGVQSSYCHCSEILVKVGDVVQRGDVIAKVGHTGNTTGNHLHFAISIDGTYVDPELCVPQNWQY